MIAKCKYCCTVFEAKRKTAIFCSDLHRTLFGKLTEEEKRLKEMAYAKLFIPATQPFLDKYGSPTEKAAEEATVTVGTGTTYSWTVPAGSTTNSNIKDPFQNYLDEFNKIIKGMPPIDKAKPALLNLKQAANNNNAI